MQIPSLHGKLDQPGFFIYTALDVKYFDEFGKAIINSVLKNCNAGIHVHLYNPRNDQINYCDTYDRVSLTYEYAPLELFELSAKKWSSVPNEGLDLLKYNRIITSMSKSDDKTIQERMQKTYYACSRFIRLASILSNQPCLAIDSDAIVRTNIKPLLSNHDFYIHHITGKKARYLAGGLYLLDSDKSKEFIISYSSELKKYIENDNLYWGLDQDILDTLVPRYNYGQLPIEYIDWEMKPHSYIWTAKGKRKDLEIFVNEMKKYSS